MITDIEKKRLEKLEEENEILRRLLFSEIYCNIVRASSMYDISDQLSEQAIKEVDDSFKRKSYLEIEELMYPKEKKYKDYEKSTKGLWESVKELMVGYK